MKITVFSIFRELVEHYCSASILGRARQSGALDLQAVDVRDYSSDRHHSVDDIPYGGGAGMVMTPGPIFAAVEAIEPPRPLFYLAPWGRRFDQSFAEELSRHEGFSLLCGRYEGVDARVEDHLVDGAISLGDFVLAGGELGAMAVIEATIRLLPEGRGNAESIADESFVDGKLEYPHYTRPAVFRSWAVPEVLLSGHHAEIAKWRLEMSKARTAAMRPDLGSHER